MNRSAPCPAPNPAAGIVAAQRDEAQKAAEDDEQPRCCGYQRRTVVRLSIVAVLVVLFILVIVDLFTSHLVTTAVGEFSKWFAKHLWLGSLIYVLLYTAMTVCLVPGSVVTLLAGFVYASALESQGVAVLLGSTVVFIGASSGSILAFVLSRWLLREWAESLVTRYRILRAIDQAVKQSGLQVTILLRLSPVIPFNLLNYALGATAVPLWTYGLGGVGMIPGTVAFVFFGTLASSIADIISGDSDRDPAIEITILVVGLVATVAAIVVITYVAKKKLAEFLEAEQEGAGQGGAVADEQESAPAVALGDDTAGMRLLEVAPRPSASSSKGSSAV